MRAAIIGCGRIGGLYESSDAVGAYTHAEAWTRCPGVELAALCDTRRAQLAKCGDRWGVRARYTDISKMMEEVRPELVSICTPDETHAAVQRVVLASESVRGVLMEKPLALDLREAGALVQLAARRGVRLAVNYSRRYGTAYARLRARLARGALGEIEQVTGYYTKGLVHNGTHWLDLARFLAGEVAWIRAEGLARGPADDPEVDVVLGFASGAAGRLANLDARDYSLFEMDLVGRKGRVRIVDSGHVLEASRVVDSPHYRGYRTLGAARSVRNAFRDATLNAARDLVASVRLGRPPRCTGEDALAALRLADAARRSLATRRGEAVA